MAQDGILGKKLIIGITDDQGNVLSTSPEILKWSVDEITNEDKKYPLGEEDEYRTLMQLGFKGSIEGQKINTWFDDIVDLKISYQQTNGGTLKFVIFTTETFKSGTVRKYKYPNVTFEGYNSSADGNNKPITNKMNWQSTNRQLVA